MEYVNERVYMEDVSKDLAEDLLERNCHTFYPFIYFPSLPFLYTVIHESIWTPIIGNFCKYIMCIIQNFFLIMRRDCYGYSGRIWYLRMYNVYRNYKTYKLVYSMNSCLIISVKSDPIKYGNLLIERMLCLIKSSNSFATITKCISAINITKLLCTFSDFFQTLPMWLCRVS